MRRLLISALLLCSAPVSAQHLAPEDYIFPLRDVAGLYSANFGEMRPNHFHSGIDIKTDGVTGKPVLATADGYISRIAVTPGGYGRAIYITHPNGTTSVYGHLSKFRDDIEKYVHEERYRTRRNSINLYPSADRFPLKQGEQFAWSGNTGSSAGPHLHFEIRDSRTQRTLNTISSGVIRTRDDIPPRLVKLYYVEVDSVRGVPVHARPNSPPRRRSPSSLPSIRSSITTRLCIRRLRLRSGHMFLRTYNPTPPWVSSAKGRFPMPEENIKTAPSPFRPAHWATSAWWPTPFRHASSPASKPESRSERAASPSACETTSPA